MRYSVWDFNQRSFGVYEDNRPRALMDDAQHCRPTMRPGVGNMIDVTRALCVLPRDARQVGWSAVAVGQVVQAPSGHGGAATGARPGLGGLGGGLLFSPGGVGRMPAPVLGQQRQQSLSEAALGVSFQEAVFINVLVSVVSGLLTTFVFKSAFNAKV